jgi:hypothetical protein
MITINLNKAKTISHEIRRQKRAEEFEPLDNLIMKQIPGTDVQAVEAERQQIRDKYTIMQTAIDETTTVDELYVVIDQT